MIANSIKSLQTSMSETQFKYDATTWHHYHVYRHLFNFTQYYSTMIIHEFIWKFKFIILFTISFLLRIIISLQNNIPIHLFNSSFCLSLNQFPLVKEIHLKLIKKHLPYFAFYTWHGIRIKVETDYRILNKSPFSKVF